MDDNVISETLVNQFHEAVLGAVCSQRIPIAVARDALAHPVMALAYGNTQEAYAYMIRMIASLSDAQGS